MSVLLDSKAKLASIFVNAYATVLT